jgi:hypothetical protein
MRLSGLLARKPAWDMRAGACLASIVYGAELGLVVMADFL